MHDSELIRRYTLDRAGIMFVTDLIWDTLTSPTPRRNAIAPDIEGNPYFNIFGNWKNTTMQQRWFLYLTARSEPYCVAVNFLWNTVSMTVW